VRWHTLARASGRDDRATHEPNKSRKLPIALAEHPHVSILEGRIASTGGRFESVPIKNFQLTPTVSDEFALLQDARGSGDPYASHAKHIGEKFMGDVKLVGVDPIAGHQQPSRQPRLNEMVAGARRGPGELTQQNVHVAVQAAPQRRAAFELMRKVRGVDAPGPAGALHKSAQWRSAHSQNERDSEHAFVAHEPNLELGALVDDGDQRNDTVYREQYVLRALPRLTECIGEAELHRLTVRQQAALISCRKNSKQVIFRQSSNLV
jgi:hypothetical protein